MIKIRGLNMQASVFAASLVLSAAAVGLSTPVFAQDAATITSQVQTNLTQAIQSSDGTPAGIAAATAQVEENAIATYGAAAASTVTQAILATPQAQGGASAGAIGAGLGQATLTLSASNPTAAGAIQQTVALEGSTGGGGGVIAGFSAATGNTNVATGGGGGGGGPTGSTGGGAGGGGAGGGGGLGALGGGAGGAGLTGGGLTGGGLTGGGASFSTPVCSGPSCS